MTRCDLICCVFSSAAGVGAVIFCAPGVLAGLAPFIVLAPLGLLSGTGLLVELLGREFGEGFLAAILVPPAC